MKQSAHCASDSAYCNQRNSYKEIISRIKIRLSQRNLNNSLLAQGSLIFVFDILFFLVEKASEFNFE